MLKKHREEPGRGRIILRAMCAALLLGAAVLPAPEKAAANLQQPTSPAFSLPGVDIRVVPPPDGAGFWSTESAGHLAALVEANLADLPNLFPQVVGAPPLRGLARAPGRGRSWELTLEVYPEADLRVQVTLCPPERAPRRAAASLDCSSFQEFGPRLHPERLALRLSGAIARQMGLPPPRRRSPGAPRASDDDYAVLLLGRSAATVFGLLPAAPPESAGDPLRDPVHRAVFVDPGMELGWSLLARITEDPAERADLLARVPKPRPSDLAERATALTEAGSHPEAWAVWREYDRLQPDDLRFAFARAAAAAAAGARSEVLGILDQVPTAALADPSAMILIDVALAERAGRLDDPLLAVWQALAPADPRPVRLRMERFLSEGRHGDALALTEALRERGTEGEARRLTLALAAHLGDPERAAEAAGALGRDEVARRLRLAAGTQAPTSPLYDEATSPEARLQGVLQWLDEGEPRKALAEARELLAERPWWPAALEAEGRAWDALGRADRSQRARTRKRYADPLGTVAFGAAAAPLAPSVSDVDASYARVDAFLSDAEAADANWSKLQKDWVDLGCARWSCRRTDGAPVAAALREAARRSRRLTQSARAEWARAKRMQTFDAVRPLLGPERSARREHLRERVQRSTRRYAARLAWNSAQVETWARVFASLVAKIESKGNLKAPPSP